MKLLLDSETGKLVSFITLADDDSQSTIATELTFGSTGDRNNWFLTHTATRNMLVAVGNDTAGYQIYACSDPTAATTNAGWSVGFIGIKGAKGDPGNAGAITSVRADGLDAGQSPTVTNEGTESAAQLVFGIPKGDQGDRGEKGEDGEPGQPGQPGPKGEDGEDGDAGRIVSITADPLAYDEDPTATNIGTDTEARIVLGIPRGIPGQDGQPGQQGQPGDPGQPGADGADGEAGKIVSIDVNPLPYTDQPTVENVGSDTEAEIVLGIPAGVPGQDGQPGEDGEDGEDGAPGADGFSPQIEIKTQDPTTYILTITTDRGTFDTMNLKGADGTGAPVWGTFVGSIDDQEDLKLILDAINNAIATKQIILTEENAGDNITIDTTIAGLPKISATGTLSQISWGDIIGDWKNQEDIKEELDSKQIKLTQSNAGDNITINDSDEDNIIISADIITSYESLTDLPTLNGEEIKGTVTLSAEDIPSISLEGDSNVQTDLTSLNTDVSDLKQDVETLTTDIDGKVNLTSSTTQIINSDIALAEGKKFLGTASNQTEHELIGINEYQSGQQVEVGSETIPICINHKEVANWSDIHPSVNYQDITGTNYEDKLAYLSEMNEVSDDFHSNGVFGKEIQPQQDQDVIIIVDNTSMPFGKNFEGQFEIDGYTYGISIIKSVQDVVGCDIWVINESGLVHSYTPGVDYIFQKVNEDGIVAMWKDTNVNPIMKFKTHKYEYINYISGTASEALSSPDTITINGNITPAKKINLDNLSNTVSNQGTSITNLQTTMADDTHNGLQSSSNYNQVISNTQAIEHLQGLAHLVKVSFQSIFSSASPSDAEIKSYLNGIGILPADYTITFLTNLDLREEWQYDTDETEFVNVGQELISIATNDDLGVVRGSSTDGKAAVEADGTLTINGWNLIASTYATLTSFNNHVANIVNHITNDERIDWNSKLASSYVPTWASISDKPSTFPATIGEGQNDAKAGNWFPSWSEITSRPAKIAAGADAAAARAEIGAGTSNLVTGTTAGTALAYNGIALTANKLNAAVAINGVNFDGSAAISVPTVISRATVAPTAYTTNSPNLDITSGEKFNISISNAVVTNVNLTPANIANQLDKTLFFKFVALPSTFQITMGNSCKILQPDRKESTMPFWDLVQGKGVIIQLTQLDTSTWLLTNYISGVTY